MISGSPSGNGRPQRDSASGQAPAWPAPLDDAIRATSRRAKRRSVRRKLCEPRSPEPQRGIIALFGPNYLQLKPHIDPNYPRSSGSGPRCSKGGYPLVRVPCMLVALGTKPSRRPEGMPPCLLRRLLRHRRRQLKVRLASWRLSALPLQRDHLAAAQSSRRSCSSGALGIKRLTRQT
jgi:hypothetical protein